MNIETYKATMALLIAQRIRVLELSKDKQARYLPRIDEWIIEVSGALEAELKEAV